VKFTKRELETIEPAPVRKVVFDEACFRLALRITPTGHKSFYYIYKSARGRSNAGKKHIYIGVFPDMTLEQAHLKARQFQAQVINGQDPAGELREAKNVQTMGEILDIFFDEHVRPKLKAWTVTQYERISQFYVKPAFGKTPPDKVTHRDVARLQHSMMDKPYMANRTSGFLSKFFNWCEANGYRNRGSNPAQQVVDEAAAKIAGSWVRPAQDGIIPFQPKRAEG
jgi:hypothetical protein